MDSIFLFLPMIIFGFLAEYIDGALGMAYGVTSASLIIAIGVLPAIASASIHTAEIFTTLIAGVAHIKFGNFRKDIGVPMGLDYCSYDRRRDSSPNCCLHLQKGSRTIVGNTYWPRARLNKFKDIYKGTRYLTLIP